MSLKTASCSLKNTNITPTLSFPTIAFKGKKLVFRTITIIKFK